MEMKISIILVEKSPSYLDGHTYPTLSFYFLYKIHSNALPLIEVVLGVNGNLSTKKLFCDQSFITMGMI